MQGSSESEWKFFFYDVKAHTSQSALTSICSRTAFIRSRWIWGECPAKGTVSKLGTIDVSTVYKRLTSFESLPIPTMKAQPPPTLRSQDFLYPSVPMQQPHNTMIEGFYDSYFHTGPVVYPSHWQTPGMAPNQQVPPSQQHQPPSSRRSHGQPKKWSRKTEHPQPYQFIHESSGVVFYDRSTGVDPGEAQIDASNNPGTGQVWITPSKNPLTADCNLT